MNNSASVIPLIYSQIHIATILAQSGYCLPNNEAASRQAAWALNDKAFGPQADSRLKPKNGPHRRKTTPKPGQSRSGLTQTYDFIV
jgi:hypothetical protein